MCSGRTSDAMTIGNVLVIHHPVVGVALEIVVNDSGQRNDIVLASAADAFDVSLKINHRRNGKRIGNGGTAVSVGNRNIINTIVHNADFLCGLAVAPSIGGEASSSSQYSRNVGIGGVVVVTRNHNNRSRINGDRNRS